MLHTVTLLLRWGSSKIGFTTTEITRQKFSSRIGRPPIEATRDSWDTRHLHGISDMGKLSKSYRVCSLRIRKATVRPLSNSVWHCLTQSEGASASFCGRLWNMDPLVHTRDQRTVEKVKWNLANMLRRERRLTYRLERWWPMFSGIHKVWSTLTTLRRTLLSKIIGWIRKRIAEKTTHLAQEKGAHISAVASVGQIGWIRFSHRF